MLRLAPCSGHLACPSFSLLSWLRPPPPRPGPTLAFSPFFEMPIFFHPVLFSPSCLVLWRHCWVPVGSLSAPCGQRAESLMVEALEDWLGWGVPEEPVQPAVSGGHLPHAWTSCPSGQEQTWRVLGPGKGCFAAAPGPFSGPVDSHWPWESQGSSSGYTGHRQT